VHAAPLLPLHRSQRLTDTWPYVTGTVAAGLVPHALRQHRRVRDVARQVADYDVPLSCDAFQVLISARLPRTFLSLRSVYMGVYEVQVTDWGTYRTRRVAQALWKAVYGRLDAAVQLALARRPLPSCPPTAPDAVRARAAAAADRRFWSDFKLFQCILAWHPWVVREALEGLACRVLLPRLLLPALRADAFDRADLVRYERVRAPTAHRAAVHYNALTLAPAAVPPPPSQVVAAIPSEWLPGPDTPLFVQPLVQQLHQAAAHAAFAATHGALAAMYACTASETERECVCTDGGAVGRELNRRVEALLERLHSRAHATAWARSHGLRA
jgi:hypothetical protein